MFYAICPLDRITLQILITTIINLYTIRSWTLDIETHDSPSLPKPDSEMIVGHYKDTIYIFGGKLHPRQWTEYDITNDIMTPKPERPLYFDIFGYTQYTQSDIYLYWVDHGQVHSFDFYSSNFRTLITGANYDDPQCLTLLHDTLFILSSNITYTYNIVNGALIEQEVEPMQISRRLHACAADPNRNEMYVIGGTKLDNPDLGTVFVEKLSTVHKKWEQTSELHYAVYGHSAVYVTFTDSIFVIGGKYQGDHEVLKYIQQIDCETGNVYSDELLNYPVAFASVVAVDNILYIFGGTDVADVAIDTWQNIEILKDVFEPTALITTTAETYTANTESADKWDLEDVKLSAEVIFIIMLVFVILLMCALLLAFYFYRRSKQYQLDVAKSVKNNEMISDANAPQQQISVVPGSPVEAKQMQHFMKQQRLTADYPEGLNTVEETVTEAHVMILNDDEFIIEDSQSGLDKDTNNDIVHKGDCSVRRVLTNTMNEGYNINNKQIKDTDVDELKHWLNSIGLKMHYDVFCKNGFESLEMIQEINDINDLEYIGIVLKAHQLKLMNHIKKIQNK